MKTRPEIAIGERAYEELMRLFPTFKERQAALGTKSKRAVYDWKCGVAPSAKYLQRLHYCGADVIYILTGIRKDGSV